MRVTRARWARYAAVVARLHGGLPLAPHFSKRDLSSGRLCALKVLGASRTGAAVWVPLDNDLPSEVVRFASLSDCSAEPTGAYFDRTGKVMYVHVQHAGGALGNDVLVAITQDKAGH